jgi:two-component system chemotaxis sensor kinase CheA
MATMTVRLASINAGLLDTFREETGEGLDRLESRLLELLARRQPELVDELFRIVHTIKGGAGTFGMMQMARLAHRMESVLDAYRAGGEPTRPAVTALLEACDALRRLLDGGASVPAQDRALEAQLDQAAKAAGVPARAPTTAIPTTTPSSGAVQPPPAPPAGPPASADRSPTRPPSPAPDVMDPTIAGVAADPIAEAIAAAPLPVRHTIRVSPTPALFRLGIDPVLLFDQLASQGDLTATVDLSAVPPLAELDPTACYLSWTLSLAGGDACVIEALFGWLDDVCPITVETDVVCLAATEPPVPDPAPRADLPPAPPDRDGVGVAPPGSAPNAQRGRAQAAAAASPAAGATIRVRLDKLDALMALVGDLVVTQSTLSMLGRAADGAKDHRNRGAIGAAIDELQRLTRSLQQSALQLRSMPISSVLDRFPRLVHDLAGQLGKEIALEIGGDSIELDKTVLERIGDPLVHLIRNSIDHGIEPPEVREAAGKPRTGRIQIAVHQRGDEVIVEISDDGRGPDPVALVARARERDLIPPGRTLSEDEIHRLIFLPGFSTAAQVSELSGRGVGMDVVVRTIHELGGDVQLRSQLGAGTTLALRLPLTLAIIEGQLVRFGGRPWVVPLSHVALCERFDPSQVTLLLGQRPVYRFGDDVVPMIDLCERLAIRRTVPGTLVLVVEAGGQHRALLIDEVGPRQQVVIKSLSAQLSRVAEVAGATVLGDGSVAFILDIATLCGDSGNHGPSRA